MTRTQFLAKEGVKGIAIGILILIFAFIFELEIVVFFSLFFLIVWACIFRNPERYPAERSENVVLAPCDGKIIDIQYQGGYITIVVRIDWVNVGLIRAPYTTQNIEIKTSHGLKTTFLSSSIIEAMNTKIYFSSDKFDLIVVPEFFKSSFYTLTDVYMADRIGFCKLGTLQVTFKDSFLDARINVGDEIKGGETILGYVK
ncbi:phosphatidylserine decarboxylase [Helicobacter anatolicus]|uniref:hypothetical protein n=1 Tax=Helicobacter anatolicus TaxID=2905874 RepID=UPI001E5C9F25|nr:hypothetical protein [Helicobacter anatolicus]MCE3038261.1 hypothetical protein [Helicobacter anatolicus]